MQNVSLRRRAAADPCGKSNAYKSSGHGSEGKRWRLPAESSDGLVQRPQEWRDWANDLLPDLIDDISGRLLASDVTEYLRFRAVCAPWRGLTADPRASLLDSRFHPRNWAVLTMTPDGRGRVRRQLLNLSTAASLAVDLPVLSSHCHLCAADGLLILYHRPTAVVSLLDPLSKVVTEFPAINSVVALNPAGSSSRTAKLVDKHAQGAIARAVNGAAFDDSTTPPTLVLCLRAAVSNIIVARPGDARWTHVNEGDAFHQMYHCHEKVLFYSLLPMRGRCYLSSPEGSVYLLNLRPIPRLVEVLNHRCLADRDTIFSMRIISFLFHDTTNSSSKMMMARIWRGIEHFAGVPECYKNYDRKKDLFTVDGFTSRIELLEVDLTTRRLLPVRSLGRAAVFVGLTHCVLISPEVFPSISADAIYLGFLHQRALSFSVLHINKKVEKRKTQPPHKFTTDHVRGLIPCDNKTSIASR